MRRWIVALVFLSMFSGLVWAGDDLFPRPEWHAKLTEPIDLEVAERPLGEVLAEIVKPLGVPLKLDDAAFQEAGVSADQPVTITVQATPRRVVFKKILGPLALHFSLADDDALVITSQENARNEQRTKLYDVDDLIDAMEFDRLKRTNRLNGGEMPSTFLDLATPVIAPAVPGGGGGGGYFDVPEAKPQPEAPAESNKPSVADVPAAAQQRVEPLPRPYRELIALVQETIEPDTWEESGGLGRIGVFSGYLVVSQTDENHEQLNRLLDRLREFLERRRRPRP